MWLKKWVNNQPPPPTSNTLTWHLGGLQSEWESDILQVALLGRRQRAGQWGGWHRWRECWEQLAAERLYKSPSPASCVNDMRCLRPGCVVPTAGADVSLLLSHRALVWCSSPARLWGRLRQQSPEDSGALVPERWREEEQGWLSPEVPGNWWRRGQGRPRSPSRGRWTCHH